MVTLTNNRAEGGGQGTSRREKESVISYYLVPIITATRQSGRSLLNPRACLDATGMYVPGCSDAMRQQETTAQPKSLL